MNAALVPTLKSEEGRMAGMRKVYGVAIRKGGQGKSTTVSTLARLCALYGARVLVIDLAQPGTTTASLRDIWQTTDHGDLATVLHTFRLLPAGAHVDLAQARTLLAEAGLPVHLVAQPSWDGGLIGILPWDELQGDAAAYLQSEWVLAGCCATLGDQYDITLIDYPAEGGPLLTNALAATDRIIMPLALETPALEGADAMLRLIARARDAGYHVDLGGILLTRADPKNKRMFEIVQAIIQTDEGDGEPLRAKLFPFAVRANEFYEQAFRYGEPIWGRTSNPAHWAGYVLLAEWLLRDAQLESLTENRRGPALLHADTRILDVSALLLDDPEVRLADFARAHALSPQR